MGLTGTEDSKIAGAATFVQSELFARTFREGMALVEETANYLDGEGREASKRLNRDAAISYASASMRLTTQLMQIASWLLVLRAVREGEMELIEAADKKYRIEYTESRPADLAAEGLPDQLLGLIEATHQLYARISRLDKDLFSAAENLLKENDAMGQQRALMEAFASRI
jgi:regulator of CtrA degradation